VFVSIKHIQKEKKYIR